MTVWPFGLLRSDAILAKNLLYGMPADALRPATDLIFARISSVISVAIGMSFRFSVTSR